MLFILKQRKKIEPLILGRIEEDFSKKIEIILFKKIAKNKYESYYQYDMPDNASTHHDGHHYGYKNLLLYIKWLMGLYKDHDGYIYRPYQKILQGRPDFPLGFFEFRLRIICLSK